MVMGDGFVHISAQALSAHENYPLVETDPSTFGGFGDGALRYPTFTVTGSLDINQKHPTLFIVHQRVSISLRMFISSSYLVSVQIGRLLKRNAGVNIFISRVVARSKVDCSENENAKFGYSRYCERRQTIA